MPPVHPFHEYPKHLHHHGSPKDDSFTAAERNTLERVGAPGVSVIVHNAEEDALARRAGYDDDYVHREYPKMVDGKLITGPPSTSKEETK